jgi:hypothetical protein
MKKLTVPLDEIYRRAGMIAAEQGTSISALVERFLVELIAAETERLKRLEREMRERVMSFNASDRLSRDEGL